MPTDTAQIYRHPRALEFALAGVAWTVGLFGLLRLGWFETHAVLPLTALQGRFAAHAFGAPALPVQVTLACSGADALALCAGAILAYPAIWPMRLAGAAGGVGLILSLNTVRIGTLGRAAGSPALFEALHLYVWPALLTLVIAGYVFAWMRVADTRRTVAAASIAPATMARTPPVTRRFVWLSAAFLVAFTAVSPLYLESPFVLAVASFITRAAAAGLRLLGIHAVATGNVLSTARGGFVVTQECISTPLIPVYFAAVAAYARHWRRGALALLAAAPLFVGLGIARLLVVALPAALIGSPIFLIHAFYQLLMAGVVVFLAAVWRHGLVATAWRRAILGALLGSAGVYLLGASYTSALTSVFAARGSLEDPQGALALLPAFQVGLYIALAVAAFVAFRWRLFAIGLALLGVSQVVFLAALHVLVRQAGFVPHVRDVRAWALVAPILVVLALVANDRPRR